MRVLKQAGPIWSRRAWLASLPLLGLTAAPIEKGRILPPEARRYADPATEFPVELLTDPQYASYLPYPYCRAIAKRGAFVLFSSDRGAGLQVFRLELKSGELKQLTGAEKLQPPTVSILPDDRSFCFFDGRTLKISSFSGLREHDVYTIPEGWELGEGFSVAGDALYAAVIEKKGNTSRLRLASLVKGGAVTLAEHQGALRHPQPRPKRASVLYQKDSELWLVNYDGQNNQRLCGLAPSSGAAHWSPDGRTVLYLANADSRVVMRENTPDTRQDRLVAPTSQYISFASNPDGTVMVGASRSLASPYVLVLIRSARRELTLGEHKSTDPNLVAPIFSPTSQRIYFQTDRHGKPAICSVVVDKFIEKTEQEEDEAEKDRRGKKGPRT